MNALFNLTEIFKKNEKSLYVVGGSVRDYILGIETFDFDLCSNLTLDEVENMLTNSNFELKNKIEKYGFCEIVAEPNKFDYATFRKDSYEKTGAHSATKIKFVKSLKTDAKRRDFTINAVYFDIIKNKLIYNFGGKKHFKKGLLVCCKNPYLSFSEDALRILRLVRFANKYNFEPSKRTFKAAKTCAPLIKNLTKQKIQNELSKMGKNTKESKLWQQLQLSHYVF